MRRSRVVEGDEICQNPFNIYEGNVCHSRFLLQGIISIMFVHGSSIDHPCKDNACDFQTCRDPVEFACMMIRTTSHVGVVFSLTEEPATKGFSFRNQRGDYTETHTKREATSWPAGRRSQ